MIVEGRVRPVGLLSLKACFRRSMIGAPTSRTTASLSRPMSSLQVTSCHPSTFLSPTA